MSCATADNTHLVLCSHFSLSQISEAKNELWKTMNYMYSEMKRTNSSKRSADEAIVVDIMYCIVLYCIMRPYTDGPIGPLSYRHSSGVVRNPHSALAE